MGTTRAGEAAETPLPPWAQPAGQLVAFPVPPDTTARPNALPVRWNDWRVPADDTALATVRAQQTELALGIPCKDERPTFSELVGSVELSEQWRAPARTLIVPLSGCTGA